MHLRDGGRGDRLRIDARERAREPHVEILVEDLLNLGEWKGRDVVLQPRERLTVRLRDDVRPRGEKLRELDVRRPKLLDVLRELARLRDLRLVGVVHLLREELREACPGDEIPAPIAEQEHREVLVALQMLGSQREVHGGAYSNLQAYLLAASLRVARLRSPL